MAIPMPSSSPSPPWIELPKDLTSNILKRLDSLELIESAQRVCSSWWNVCKDPEMWRVIDMSYPIDIYDYHPYNLTEIFSHAVDRSQGESIDINMQYLVRTEELLQYLSTRSGHIRRLRIAYRSDISLEGLIEVVQNNPLLEELHLSFTTSSISHRDVETIGLSCPMLKSFTFDYRTDHWTYDNNDWYAITISETMPNLRHLRLVGNRMTNKGLKAILDGCVHLESLDLRRWRNLHLDEDLRTMCSQRVKDLRLPSDSIDEYEFEEKREASDDNDLEPYDGFSDNHSERHWGYSDNEFDNELPYDPEYYD